MCVHTMVMEILWLMNKVINNTICVCGGFQKQNDDETDYLYFGVVGERLQGGL